ncbi:MAG: flagellar hook-basal body complex protein FliE [Deltaproteobacteria bacterium]|nr:flagellar hook-basal body complex protein FliE [Deltaproteobacteria bacterium]
MSEIQIIPGIGAVPQAPKAAAGGEHEGGPSFLDALQKALSETTELQKSADAAAVNLQTGKAGIHETLLAVEKAEISFRMLMQVRNKVMEAYKEVMRMNV